MSATNGHGRILAVGAELPPMASRAAAGNSKAKGVPKRKAGERFAVLNAFVDFTAGTLPRSELLVWLTLFRDARDGITRTAQADIARRTGLGRRTVGMAIAKLAKRGAARRSSPRRIEPGAGELSTSGRSPLTVHVRSSCCALTCADSLRAPAQ